MPMPISLPGRIHHPFASLVAPVPAGTKTGQLDHLDHRRYGAINILYTEGVCIWPPYYAVYHNALHQGGWIGEEAMN